MASPIMQQLDQARAMALQNPAFYPTILPGILPIIGPQNPLEQQRWGADFLAEIFATPVLGPEEKQQLSLQALPIMKQLMGAKDIWVVKSVIQAAASIYPIIFRYTIHNPTDPETWRTMDSIKKDILRRMDSFPPGVKICCIKFVQVVIQTQTPGIIADPRRPERNEVSLALVPRGHPLMHPPNLEAEASGLLDRLLSMLQDNSSDALLVTATMNSMGQLQRSRASIANKIVSTVLNYNPLKLANAPMTPKTKVYIKSLAQTTKSFLVNIIKRNPHHPMERRINDYLTRLHQARIDVFDENNRKRAAPTEPTDGLDQAKRQRLGAEVPHTGQTPVPALPAGPVSAAQLFSLTDDKTRNFDVTQLNIDVIHQLLVPMLKAVDRRKFDNAINAVRSRYISLQGRAAPAPSALADQPVAGDDDEDYEPDYEPTEDAEQVANRLNDEIPAGRPSPDIAVGPYKLPKPPALSSEEVDSVSQRTVARMFEYLKSLPLPDGNAPKAGLNRISWNPHDRDGYLLVMLRIATRATAVLDDGAVKSEGYGSPKNAYNVANGIRDGLFKYIMDDFRRRMDVAIKWLSEEWISEKMMSERQSTGASPPQQRYFDVYFRLSDAILPFLDAGDRKILPKFLAEPPELHKKVLDDVKRLAKDPERVTMVVAALQYVVLFKTTAREMSLDAIEDLWRNTDGAKAMTEKILKKWRPALFQQPPTEAKPSVEAQPSIKAEPSTEVGSTTEGNVV